MKKTLAAIAAGLLFAGVAVADEITLMIYAQPQEKEILNQVIDRFEKTHKGTKVNFITSTQAEYDQKITGSACC